MNRYATRRPKADDDREPWEMEYPFTPSLQVDMTEAKPTGLLDKHGHELVRLPEAMGFLANRKGQSK